MRPLEWLFGVGEQLPLWGMLSPSFGQPRGGWLPSAQVTGLLVALE